MVSDLVRVTFGDCKSGWINFHIETGDQSASISASHISDPFPAMIDWLHTVVGGSPFSHWSIDEEGRTTSILLARRPDGLARLRVVGSQGGLPTPVSAIPSQANEYDTLYVDAQVDPAQVAEAFFTAFDTFIGGNTYCPTEWEAITLRRGLNRVLPGVGINDLAAVSPVDLALLANTLAHPGAIWKAGFLQETLAEYLGRKRMEGWVPWAATGVIPTDLIDAPECGSVEVPADLDRWPIDERRTFIDRFLEGWVTSWNGDNLVELLAGEIAMHVRGFLQRR